jgi:3-dehydroquinate synthase
MDKDILTLADLIKMCIKLKISVVNQDEKEKGLRKILNYGHTYGHAVETITNFSKYTHGECVVSGILFAINMAFKMGKIDKEYKFLSEDLISKFDFPRIPQFDKNKIINIMRADKKAGSDYLTFILPTSYAQVETFKFEPDKISF